MHPQWARIVVAFLPVWVFLALFKFGGGLHYAVLSPLGERVLPLSLVGIVIGLEALAQMLLDVPAGFLVDRFGSLRLLRFSSVMFLITAAILIFFDFSLPVYLATVALSTLGWLFYSPGINAYVLTNATAGESGRFLSMRDMSASIGTVAASIALTFVLMLSPNAIGVIVFALIACALFALSFAGPDTGRGRPEQKIETHHYYIRRRHPHTLLSAFRKLNPAALMLCLLSFSSAVFYGTVWFVVPLVIAQQAAGSLLTGIGLGVFDMTIVLLGYWLGLLADRADKRTLVFFGLLLFALAGMFIGYSFSWLFLVFGFLATSGSETAGLSLWSWLHALDRDHAHDGMVAGVITFAEDAGWTVGPVFAGFSYMMWGPAITLALGAACIFVTWLVYVAIARSHASVPVASLPHFPLHKRHK